ERWSVTAQSSEAIGTWADVTGDLDRATAERALVPAGGDDGLRPAGETGRRGGFEAHDQAVGGLVVLALGHRERLDRHRSGLVIPRERHGADAELLLDRLVQRRAVHLAVCRHLDIAVLLDLGE